MSAASLTESALTSTAMLDGSADRRRRLCRPVVDESLTRHAEADRQPKLVRRDHFGTDTVAVQPDSTAGTGFVLYE